MSHLLSGLSHPRSSGRSSERLCPVQVNMFALSVRVRWEALKGGGAQSSQTRSRVTDEVIRLRLRVQ